ncbi:MAG TPA: sigma factor, partial [Pirellulales bacterium]|nr:sigma factor [Pirellulales bacterium]
MSANLSSHVPPGPRGFATTRWSLVLAAGGQATARSRQALATLCEGYWQPLYAYVRRRGFAADEAQDLTQDFFAALLEKDAVQRADPQRGRFRSFLLGSL